MSLYLNHDPDFDLESDELRKKHSRIRWKINKKEWKHIESAPTPRWIEIAMNSKKS
jgi:hypothetical protein